MTLENSLVLGRYRVLWLVDQKKLVRSYIARDQSSEAFGSPVLIKQFLHDLGDQQSAPVRALFDELGALTDLRHSGVVSLLEFGMVDKCLVTAAAYLPGVDLQVLCEHFSREKQPFPPRLAIYIARRVLDTLHYCHTRASRPYLHGRITLRSIHLPGSGEPQIMDFGLARLEEAAAEVESHLGFFQTRMSFSAPEITRGSAPTLQGDTYSVALLLYRLLAGNNPFRGSSIPETLQRVLQLTPSALIVPHWSGEAQLNAILGRALSKEPGARHASAEELSQALAPLQEGAPGELAEELAALVRRLSTADWRQIAKLTPIERKSRPPLDEGLSRAPAQELRVAGFRESRAPAFVSGLLTDKPRSASEHTLRDRQQARERRQRARRLAMLPGVFLPAAAIIVGLFLGRLGQSTSSPGASAAAAAPAPAQLSSGSLTELRAQLHECGGGLRFEPRANVQLDFGKSGELSEVRVNPASLVQTRVGSCLLRRVWEAGVGAPAALSLVIPLDQL
jgi:serine/threonine protein kinase